MNEKQKQRYAIEQKNIEKIKKTFPWFLKEYEKTGIYILIRKDDGFKYAYVGQTKQPIIKRLAQHLIGYEQIIDKSLKNRGLFSEENKTGWVLDRIEEVDIDKLDIEERNWERIYANNGYQLYNRTTGGQGEDKSGMIETSRKGYLKGKADGHKKAFDDLRKYFNIIYKNNEACTKSGKYKVDAKRLHDEFYESEEDEE